MQVESFPKEGYTYSASQVSQIYPGNQYSKITFIFDSKLTVTKCNTRYQKHCPLLKTGKIMKNIQNNELVPFLL